MAGYSISEVAQRFQLEPHTLRYYEKEGILSPKKTAKGIRVYSESDIDQLGMVCCLTGTGMSLKDIKRYFDLCDEGDGTIQERLAIFEAHRRHILDEIEDLKMHLNKIEKKITWYKGVHGVK